MKYIEESLSKSKKKEKTILSSVLLHYGKIVPSGSWLK